MYCPVCHSKETKVIDSRMTQEGFSIRRRRECEKCSYRFSTVEQVELLDTIVVKRDGEREAYARTKLEKGILQSLVKRPYTQEMFDKLLGAIERDIQKKKKREITSKEIGDLVMKQLKKFDTVAYIRFASIYRSFEDADTFQHELATLTENGKRTKRRK